MAEGELPVVPDGGPVLTVFRSRLREDAGEAYRATAARMLALAESMPGFVEFKTFTADDGEQVSIAVFDSPEAQAAWRDHPEHRAAQATGRADFYAEYRVQVCRLVDERAFRRPTAG